jgi:hypothetical protein
MAILVSFRQSLIKSTGLIFFMIACGISIVNLQQPHLSLLLKKNLYQTDYKKEEELDKVNLDILNNLPAFGFDNMLANWTMLQFIQYYGDEAAREKTGYSLSPNYLEVITKNDPRFTSAYLILSPASSINAGRPDRTVALMAKGLKQLSPKIPDAYFVWLYKGVDELLFLGDIQAAKQSYQMAANWAKVAQDQRIAQAAGDTVQFLAKNPNSKVAQVGAWFMVFTNASDRQTRHLAKQKIEQLGGKLELYPGGRVTAIPPKE